MALLDVTDLLSDVDIAGDEITVTRNTRTVSTDGMTVDVPSVLTTYGNAQPSTGRQLQQLPEEQRVGAFMTFYVPITLIALSLTTASDIVTWDNDMYRIVHIMPWDNYGQGFSVAIGQLIGPAVTASV